MPSQVKKWLDPVTAAKIEMHCGDPIKALQLHLRSEDAEEVYQSYFVANANFVRPRRNSREGTGIFNLHGRYSRRSSDLLEAPGKEGKHSRGNSLELSQAMMAAVKGTGGKHSRTNSQDMNQAQLATVKGTGGKHSRCSSLELTQAQLGAAKGAGGRHSRRGSRDLTEAQLAALTLSPQKPASGDPPPYTPSTLTCSPPLTLSHHLQVDSIPKEPPEAKAKSRTFNVGLARVSSPL